MAATSARPWMSVSSRASCGASSCIICLSVDRVTTCGFVAVSRSVTRLTLWRSALLFSAMRFATSDRSSWVVRSYAFDFAVGFVRWFLSKK